MEVFEQRAVVVNVLQVATVLEDTVAVAGLNVLVTAHISEAPLLRDNDLLATSELVTRAAQSLNRVRAVHVTGADREEDLTNVDTSDKVVWPTERTTHTSLQTVGTGARKHLVDTNDVVGVDTHTKVEALLTSRTSHVLVRADTSSLNGLVGDLLVLVTDQVHTEGEVIDRRLLATKVVNAELRVRDTTVVPRLGVRLVLAVTVAASWAASHLGVAR